MADEPPSDPLSALSVGMRAERTRTVTDADLRHFADATGDDNPIHFDAGAAAGPPFHGRVAHGMLSAGMISAVLGMELPGPGTVYLSQTLKFLRPVRIGDRITASVEVVEVIQAKRRIRLATRCSNQNGQVVVDGEAVVMLPVRGG